MSTFTIADLEVAIKNCIACEAAEKHCLSRDASKLGDVYGAMIWDREESRTFETLSIAELEAFMRWRII